MKGGENDMKQTDFKVGDEVRIIIDGLQSDCINCYQVGDICKIDSFTRHNKALLQRRYDGTKQYVILSDFELVSPKSPAKQAMTQFKALARRILDSETRTLIKIGWLSESLEITDEGKDFALAEYFFDNKKRFAEIAKKRMQDEKACK